MAISKPRIERCGNHWCVEWFNQSQFFSRCFMDWKDCLRVALGLCPMKSAAAFCRNRAVIYVDSEHPAALAFEQAYRAGKLKWQ